MRMHKKGALELSINAIVVLILAITILGLGIAFIRGQFGALQKQFTEVSGEVKTQLTEKIKQSGELLVFSQQEVNVQAGKADQFYYGIQNEHTDVPVCAVTLIRCINALSGNGCPGSNNGEPVLVGGPKAMTPNPQWFSLFSPVDIAAGDVGVFQMTVQVSNAPKDTYLMEMVVVKPTSGNTPTALACATAADSTEGAYDITSGDIKTGMSGFSKVSKQFFLTVT